MVFMTQDMISITDAAYASLLLEQNDFQASEATLKVLGLYPLNTVIAGSTDTLGIALTNLPDPTACNYLFCSIEPPLSPQNNVIFLCFNRQFISYTSLHLCIQHLSYFTQKYRKLRSGLHQVSTQAPPPFQKYLPAPILIFKQY